MTFVAAERPSSIHWHGHTYNQEPSPMFEPTNERLFCSVRARSELFAKLSAFLAGKDGPFLIATVTSDALDVKFNNLSRFDRDMIRRTMRNLGWELRRPHWYRRDAERAAA
jgi:hypothetical protein